MTTQKFASGPYKGESLKWFKTIEIAHGAIGRLCAQEEIRTRKRPDQTTTVLRVLIGDIKIDDQDAKLIRAIIEEKIE